jgi:hypothetical protein
MLYLRRVDIFGGISSRESVLRRMQRHILMFPRRMQRHILSFLSCAYSADLGLIRHFDMGLNMFTLCNIFNNGDVSSDADEIQAATNP